MCRKKHKGCSNKITQLISGSSALQLLEGRTLSAEGVTREERSMIGLTFFKNSFSQRGLLFMFSLSYNYMYREVKMRERKQRFSKSWSSVLKPWKKQNCILFFRQSALHDSFSKLRHPWLLCTYFQASKAPLWLILINCPKTESIINELIVTSCP